MGNFITILKQNSKQLPSKQTQNKKGYSLNKLREYHGTFKSICDTFAIDTKDFENIFGSNETNSDILKFDLWDTDKNKLIDALELFAGLIMFSNDNFSEKVRFLFDIFDFNELNSLSIIDIEFMLISCCNATFKIFSMQSDINEENISEFLRQDFKEDERINISQMIQWCAQKQEIIEFCQLIHAKPPEQSQKQIGQQQQFNYNKPVNQVKNLPQIINGKKYQQKLDWLSALSKKLKFLNQSHFSTASKDVSIKPKWVYGFRSQGVKKPLAHIKQGQTDKLIYFTANIVVIYYPNLNKQEHYLEHQREVISLGVAKKSGLVASGELGSRPAIHIWNNESLLNLGVIQGIHQIGINFINFFNNDEFIVTAGMRYNSPILIYNIKDLSLVLSTHINDFSLSVLTVQNYIGSFAQSMYSSNSTRDTRNQKQNAKQMNKSLNSSVISYIGTQAQQVDSEDLFDNYENAFFIFTQSEIILFIYIDNHFKQETVKIHQINPDEDVKDEIQVQGNLTCALVLRANSVNPYLKAYTEEGDGAVQIVFGTDKGYLYYFNWGEFEKKKEFSYQQHYQSSIVNLCSYKYGVIVGVGDSTIHLWDFNFQHNIKNLDLTAFSFKLFSYDIIDILEMNSQLLISTTNGDIIEIDMNQKQEWTQNKFIQKLNANRVNYITKFGGELNAMCIMERAENDDKILFAAGSAAVIYGFSLETHEIVDVWSIGGDQPITCMDCVNFEDGGTVFVFGTAGTPAKLIMRIDWEEQPRTLEIAQTVHDVKFSSDTYYLIACCNDYCIYLYQHNQNHYFNVLPKKIQLDNEIPISIDFVDDNKSFLVGTSVRNQYKIELPELKNKQILHENEKINCTMWTLRYPLHTKNFQQNMLPIIIGGDLKVFLCAGESGYLYFWRDHEQLETNCGGFLKGHASQISRIKMSQSQDVFFTLGQKDQTIIEWQVDFINDFNDFSKPFPSGQNMMLAQQSLEKQILIKDEVLVKELAYSYQGKNDFISDTFKDQFLLFRGTNQKTLNSHLSDLLGQENNNSEESLLLNKRPPPLSMQLDFVYGFASFDKRQTLQYVHLYSLNDISQQMNENKKEEQKKKIRIQNNYQASQIEIAKKLSKNNEILDYQKDKLIEKNSVDNQQLCLYEQYHEHCQRLFVYFISRVAIIYNPVNNKQRFYEGHKHKITAIAVHPLKFYVASGDASAKPNIHVWNVLNCEPYKILQTYHKNGIIHLAFSQDQDLIISSGIDIQFSIQVTNWKTEEVVAFRNSGQYHIFDIKFNPFNCYEFISCGAQNITIWDLNGRNLLRKYIINVAEESVYGQSCCITCCSYISFMMNNQLNSDIVVGNNFGDLALVTCGKYILAKPKAHNKMINCLKVTEAFKNNVIIITAGEDEMIKFWDTKFNQINQISIQSMKSVDSTASFFSYYQDIQNNQKSVNCSCQSLDVFICFKDLVPMQTKNIDDRKKNKALTKLKNKVWPKILVGTRNGDILEATFSLDYAQFEKKKKQRDELKRQNNAIIRQKQGIYHDDTSQSSEEEDEDEIFSNLYGQESKGFKFDYNLFLRSHSSQIFKEQNFSKKVYFALHPIQPIMVTVGEDQNLCVIDILSNKLLSIEYLSQKPSAIKFSPEGDLLVLGLVKGTVMIYDSKIKKNVYGKPGDKYDLTRLTQSLIQEIKLVDRQEAAVLNIEFSQNGEMLAVSYDNARMQKELEGKYEKEGSFIRIFSNRASHKNNKARGQEKLLYTQHIDIRCPSTYESYKTEDNAYGCAVYFMTFSQEQDKEYLLIYYQLVDNYLARVNHDSQGTYLIWDLTNNNAVKQWDSIKNIQWRCFNFPNSINSQYQYYQNQIIQEENRDQNQQIAVSQAPPFQSVMFDMRVWENQNYQYLVTGSLHGDLHFVKNACLSGEKDFQTENIPKEKMFLAKSYAGHVSFVNQIEASQSYQQYLFTTGNTDECIFKWKFIQEEQLWDLDYLEYKLDQTDVFSELIKKDKFINLYSEILPLRKQSADVRQNQDETKISPVELKLKNIIGRNAYTKLNNLFYDYNENIVYTAGCNLIINSQSREEEQDYEDYDENEKNKIIQHVIKLDQSKYSCDSEISAFSLSQDKKFLVAGSVQIQAKITIWDICSRTCITTFSLKDVPIILLIKFACDNRHICCVGLTSEYTTKVFLIDSLNAQVLGCANMPYTLPFKIKDIEFLPDSIHKFVTCGVQHMTLWSLNGGILGYQSMEIENPQDIEDQKKQTQNAIEKQDKLKKRLELNNDRDLDEDDDDEEDGQQQDDEIEFNKESLRVIFLCMTFVYDIIITGGEDGYLYIWEDKQIKQKHLTQKKIIVMALNSLRNSNVFVSGSMNGVVNLWSIQRGDYYFIIEKIQEFNISKEDSIESIKYSANIIQSLCIGSKYILVGTKSGDIYELQWAGFNNHEQKQKHFQKGIQDYSSSLVNLKLSCNDDEIPQAISFSNNSSELYTITQRGLFSVWDIKSLKRKYIKSFAIETHGLIVCKNSNKVIIAFETEIRVLNKETIEETIQFVIGNKIVLESSISDIKMSSKENQLAIALNPSKEQSAKIEIYDANREDGNFKILCQVQNLPSSIEYLDFTQDNNYLMYKDNLEEVSIIDLKNLKKINVLFVENDVKWCSDGIKVSEKIKGVYNYYSDENNIEKITTIGQNAIAVTDEMGTLRLFNYPCNQGVGHGYTKCYTDHLNYINQCVVSDDLKYMVTCSQNDRCIIIWDIIQNKEAQNMKDSDDEGMDEEDEDQNRGLELGQEQQ